MSSENNNNEDCMIPDDIPSDDIPDAFYKDMKTCFENGQRILADTVDLSNGNGQIIGYSLMYALAMAHVSVVGNNTDSDELLIESFKEVLSFMHERATAALMVEKETVDKLGGVQ